MNLKDYVGDAGVPQYLRRPFRLEIEGQPWACACDSFAFVGVKADLKVPHFGGPTEDLRLIQTWLQAVPFKPKTVQAADLLELSGPIETEERLSVVLGVQVDRNRLTKLLKGLKGDIIVWTANLTVGIPSLGFARGDVWRAILAGHEKVDPDVPVFDLTTPSDLFDLVMNA